MNALADSEDGVDPDLPGIGWTAQTSISIPICKDFDFWKLSSKLETHCHVIAIRQIGGKIQNTKQIPASFAAKSLQSANHPPRYQS